MEKNISRFEVKLNFIDAPAFVFRVYTCASACAVRASLAPTAWKFVCQPNSIILAFIKKIISLNLNNLLDGKELHRYIFQRVFSLKI